MSNTLNHLKHISLNIGQQDALLRESLYSALTEAIVNSIPNSSTASILDVGAGRGELLKRLSEKGYKTYGVDLEAACVQAASQFGDVRQGGIHDVETLFKDQHFDVVVCSHVLEHVDSPCDALKEFAKLNASAYVFAVPNPLRPIRILRAIFNSKKPDHPEHVYAWGKPEFKALLNRTGFEVEEWYSDRVSFNPIRGKLGYIFTRFLKPFETHFLTWLFPSLSSSLIVRCRLIK
jgi:SAM-dependent methyltransferase